MAFISWAELHRQMLDDLSSGNWDRVQSYSISTGGSTRTSAIALGTISKNSSFLLPAWRNRKTLTFMDAPLLAMEGGANGALGSHSSHWRIILPRWMSSLSM